MQKISKELIGASSIPILLTVIAKDESYGYEIIQRVKEISGGHIEWGEGTLYPVLHKMEKKGLITSSWKTGSTKRKRKYYKITVLGKSELTKEKENWTLINNVILKLWKIDTNLI